MKKSNIDKYGKTVPLCHAEETMEPWCSLVKGKSFTNELGSKLVELSGEKRTTEFLQQRIVLAIQCGNVAAVKGMVKGSRSLKEVEDYN